MEDSFFGFDTSAPLYDDGGGGRLEEPSEEEYDALNDETFGSAVNGDWEEAHENLVRLTDILDETNGLSDAFERKRQRNSKPKGKIDHLSDSDLELNLSDMKLDDLKLDESNNVISSDNILLDPSVWSPGPIKSLNSVKNVLPQNGSGNKALAYLQHFQNLYPYANFESNANLLPRKQVSQSSQPSPIPKICTLEDIEKNLIKQQTVKQQHQQQQNQQQQIQTGREFPSRSTTPSQPQIHPNEVKHQLYPQNSLPSHNQQQQQPPPQQPQQQQLQTQGPPGFLVNPHQMKQTNQLMNNVNNPHISALLQQQPAAVNNAITPQMNNMTQQQTQPNNGMLPHLGVNQPQNPLFQNRPMSTGPGQHPPLLPHHLQHGAPAPIPPHPLLNQHMFPNNFAFPRPMPSPHLPVALNNFAMHPNFAAMRAAAAAAGLHPAAFISPHQPMTRFPPAQVNPSLIPNQQQQNAMFNMFNMRLVQEIQQNHPLLQSSLRQSQQNLTSLQSMQQKVGNMKNNNLRRDGLNANGNLPAEEFDEYANLMSTRDKHWLIGIQLSQLNSDTPYIDDYYYTMHRERKAAQNGAFGNSKAHKDNQLNHPLTQPKGHAQLVLVQLGNKNGTRNGQQRERRTSENNDQRAPYGFVAYNFENSLGKLQFGSVNAPRKLIDAEVMNSESSSGSKTSTQTKQVFETAPILPQDTINKVTISTQRKTRDTLLHIEALFRIVLKLEDLENPTIMTTILAKKKKESERLAVLEQLENANKVEDREVDTTSVQVLNPALRNRFNYEIETKEALLEKLFTGLSRDKVIAMMHVRKGKVLLSRIMPHISGDTASWQIWNAIFSSLPSILKKDRDDPEGTLYALYPEFKKQISKANFDTIVKMVTAVILEEKKASGILSNKFAMSALVALILRVEQIYIDQNDKTFDKTREEAWAKFLKKAASSLASTIQIQTISATIESESIQPMMNHFARFKNLNLKALSSFIKEAKEQIK